MMCLKRWANIEGRQVRFLFVLFLNISVLILPWAKLESYIVVAALNNRLHQKIYTLYADAPPTSIQITNLKC